VRARKRAFFPNVINTDDSDSPTSADSDRQVDIKPLSLAGFAKLRQTITITHNIQ